MSKLILFLGGGRLVANELSKSGQWAQHCVFDRLVCPPGAFRVCLAGLVVLSHFSSLQVGRLGVALFFMLSGFWISSLWNRVGGYSHVLKFFGNRVFRIYPLYLTVVLLCLALFPCHITPSTFLLLGVASTDGPRAIGVEWSLDIELEFYLLFPLLYTIARLSLAYSLVIFALLTLLGWFVAERYEFVNVLQYLPMFYIGMRLFLTKTRFSTHIALLSLAVFGVFFVICCALPATHSLAILSGRPPMVNADIFAMVWACLLSPYVGASVRRRSESLDRMLGDSSYPFYLIHVPIIRFAAEFFPIITIARKAALLLAIVVACCVLYLLVDRPMEALRRRLLD